MTIIILTRDYLCTHGARAHMGKCKPTARVRMSYNIMHTWLSDYILSCTTVIFTQQKAFPLRAKIVLKKVGRKIHILNRNIGSGQKHMRNKRAHVATNNRWQSLYWLGIIYHTGLERAWENANWGQEYAWATTSYIHDWATTSYHAQQSYSRSKKGSVSPFSPCGRKLYWKDWAENSYSQSKY